MKILFHANHLDIRGTGQAIFSYAFYNQTLLNNESVIIVRKNSPHTNELVTKKFEKEFKIVWYDHLTEKLDDVLAKEKGDLFYALKGGSPGDGIISKIMPNAMHGVFNMDPPHGEKFAVISEWLSKFVKETHGHIVPVVPHIVELPKVNEDLRGRLDIPKDAFVAGYHGGAESFNINYVHNAIKRALAVRKDLYFIFMNITPFYAHDHIRYIKGTADVYKKALFINTADVCLHARSLGESFGLSIAEFSIYNKPVLTCFDCHDRNHIETLGDKGFYYRNENDVFQLLLNNYDKTKNYNCYEQFNPNNVMQQFKKVFIDDV
jgi:hypothetical protein